MTVASASRPRLLVVAGPNGAGKTTITERGLAHEWFHDCEYVNPDAIAQDELGDWNDATLVLRAAQLATERREACLREGRSLAFETVFSAADKPDFIRRALGLPAAGSLSPNRASEFCPNSQPTPSLQEQESSGVAKTSRALAGTV